MDLYTILNVAKDASQATIKNSYRNLAKQWHPDKNGGDDTTFKKIQNAYEVLSDEERREHYDATGSETREPTLDDIAVSEIDSLLDSVLNQISDPKYESITDIALNAVKYQLDKLSTDLSDLRQTLNHIHIMRKRVTKDHESGVIIKYLNRKEHTTCNTVKQILDGIEIMDKMLDILEDCDYKCDTKEVDDNYFGTSNSSHTEDLSRMLSYIQSQRQ